jgi:hypothetical protein
MAPTCPERELLADEESKAKFAVEDHHAKQGQLVTRDQENEGFRRSDNYTQGSTKA